MVSPSLSIVIPAFNEEALILQTLTEIYSYCRRQQILFEIIVVDDASTDDTTSIISSFIKTHPECRMVRNVNNIGCHPSVLVGFSKATMDWIVFLPGDGQISPDIINTAIPLMPKHHLLCTHRTLRNDPWYRVAISQFYNFIIRLITGLNIMDFDSAILVRRDFYEKISPLLRSRSASLSVEIAVQTFVHSGIIGQFSICHRPRTAGIARGLNWRDVRGVPKNLIRIARLVLPTRYHALRTRFFGYQVPRSQ